MNETKQLIYHRSFLFLKKRSSSLFLQASILDRREKNNWNTAQFPLSSPLFINSACSCSTQGSSQAVLCFWLNIAVSSLNGVFSGENFNFRWLEKAGVELHLNFLKILRWRAPGLFFPARRHMAKRRAKSRKMAPKRKFTHFKYWVTNTSEMWKFESAGASVYHELHEVDLAGVLETGYWQLSD